MNTRGFGIWWMVKRGGRRFNHPSPAWVPALNRGCFVDADDGCDERGGDYLTSTTF